MNPIRALHDFSRKRKLAAALLDTLTKRGRPGGLDVTRQDPESAAALMYLLAHNNDVTVVKNKKNLTLMFKSDVDRIFTPDLARTMDRAGLLALPGEDLVDERHDG
jgi:hypothetical protein